MQRLRPGRPSTWPALGLIDRRLFRGELRIDRVPRKAESLLLDLVAVRQLRLLHFRSLVLELCDQAVLRQLIVRSRAPSSPVRNRIGPCAVVDSWSSNSRCSVARKVTSSDSAAFNCNSASWAACSTSGLLISKITVSGSTCAPGRTIIFSTRPSVFAGIQRMSSGTSVPSPRTCRTIGPRFTVSIQTVERSTVGTAGFNREKPIVARITPSATAEMVMIRRLRFFAATSGPWNIHRGETRSKPAGPHNCTFRFCFALGHLGVDSCRDQIPPIVRIRPITA